MVSASFLLRRWVRVHDHLVEECVVARRVLHVADVLPDLTQHWHHRIISRWNPPSHPRLTLVPRMGGPFRRWWFLCPRCRRRCESLYTLPGAPRDEWRCRVCHGLIYASQRHGFRHPLRRVLTRRKKISQRKDVLRAERRMTRHQVRLPAAEEAIMAERAADTDRWVLEMRERLLAHFAPAPKPAGTVIITVESAPGADPRGRTPAIRGAQALIDAEVERSLATLRDLAERAGSKRVREQARRDLARHEQRLGGSADASRTT